MAKGMTRHHPIPAAALVAAFALSTACTYGHSSSPLSPTTPGGSNSPTPMTGLWATQTASLPSPSSCGNLMWSISNQTSTTISGTFTADCPGGVSVSGNASGQFIDSQHVPITVTGTATGVSGIASCPFTINANGVIQDSNTLQVTYTGTTCVGPLQGTQTLRRATASTPPPPTPPPPAPPPPANILPASQVTFVNNPPDIASWAVTAKITFVQFRSDALIVDFDRRTGDNAWPDLPFDPGGSLSGGGIQYTLGLCFNLNGWYCSAAIQFWQGRELEAGAAPSSIPQTWYYDSRWAPMNGYLPAQGETVGIFVVHGNVRNLHDGSQLLAHERSEIVLVPFDRGNGTSYTFSQGRLLKR